MQIIHNSKSDGLSSDFSRPTSLRKISETWCPREKNKCLLCLKGCFQLLTYQRDRAQPCQLFPTYKKMYSSSKTGCGCQSS